jgi:hypothetical protein
MPFASSATCEGGEGAFRFDRLAVEPHDFAVARRHGPEPRPPYHVTAPETLEALMTRDLQAWTEAKAAIDKARGR